MNVTSLGSQLADNYDRPRCYCNDGSISAVKRRRWMLTSHVYLFVCSHAVDLIVHATHRHSGSSSSRTWRWSRVNFVLLDELYNDKKPSQSDERLNKYGCL